MSLAALLPTLLADVPKLPTSVENLDTRALTGLLPVAAGCLGVILLALIWALYIRRTPKDPRARVLSDSAPSSGRRRRRHKKREHRPSNPTLSETGGLPPVKSESEQDTSP